MMIPQPIVLLASVPFWVMPIAAQQPVSVIPANQKPIGKLFPPREDERCESGTGKFVIFTREEVGGVGEWDFIAGAWECIPSRPEVPITKRVEFCHSSWEPNPLLGVLANDGEGSFPRFVRLWVDDPEIDRYTNLYDIDYRTWDVKCIWQGESLSSFGVSGGKIYTRGDEDQWLLIDSKSGKITAKPKVEPVGGAGKFWLVRKPGEEPGSGCWSYHREREEFVSHFGSVKWNRLDFTSWRLSEDGAHRAWLVAPVSLEWNGGEFAGKLIVQRQGQDEDIVVPVTLNGYAGSGVRVIPLGMRFLFTEDGKVELRVQDSKRPKVDRVWTIELEGGKIVSRESPHKQAEPAAGEEEEFHGVPVVDYLSDALDDFRHFGRSGLAPAFLMNQGMLKTAPGYPDCQAGVSPDGRHIIFCAEKGLLAGQFIYGDLHKKKIVKWEAPAGLPEGSALDFAWVVTP